MERRDFLAPPSPTAQISISDIINMRLALDTIKNPSTEILTAIKLMDLIICDFAKSLSPTQGPNS